MLTAGKEEAYLLPTMIMMSTATDATQVARTLYLLHYLQPGGMRAGFQHYGTLLADGQENRATFRDKLTMPMLVLNGERGIPQDQTLSCVEQVAEHIEAEVIPDSGHAFADDKPLWVAERLNRFFR